MENILWLNICFCVFPHKKDGYSSLGFCSFSVYAGSWILEHQSEWFRDQSENRYLGLCVGRLRPALQNIRMRNNYFRMSFWGYEGSMWKKNLLTLFVNFLGNNLVPKLSRKSLNLPHFLGVFHRAVVVVLTM